LETNPGIQQSLGKGQDEEVAKRTMIRAVTAEGHPDVLFIGVQHQKYQA
jgi:hypothetical protein